MRGLIALFLPLAIAASDRAAPTPAQKAMAGAEEQIRKSPGVAEPHANLAKALVRRAQETGDPNYYEKAEKSVADALRLAPEDFEALKARVMILIGRQEYAPALELARKLNRRIPDDVLVYGLIADACMATGDYAQAEESAQWMLDLRRGNLPGMTRGAALRALFGDISGAIDWYTSVFKLTSPIETEQRARLLTEIARLRLAGGKVEAAETLVQQALEMFPDYYYSLETLAELRSAAGKFVEAAETWRGLYQSRPRPGYLFRLAVATDRAGQAEEATRLFAEFERRALDASSKPDNANRELILYYVDYAGKAPEALALAKQEIGRRRDILTLDAYAWALRASGELTEARETIEKALKTGVQDAGLFEHAARIAEELKDAPSAARYERRAREMRP
jgi:tetratricopeptide (TPR) repeat protein